MSTRKKTYISYLPPEMEAVVVQYAPRLLISCVIPPKRRKIIIQEKFAGWKAENCERGCEFHATATVLAELRTNFIKTFQEEKNRLPRTLEIDKYLNKAIKERKLCPATEDIARGNNEDGKVCQKGLTYRSPSSMEVDVPKTLWTFDLSLPLTNGTRDVFHQYVITDKHPRSAADPELFPVGGLYGMPYQLANVYDHGDVCWGTGNAIPKDIFQAVNTYWNAPFNRDLVRNFQFSLHYTLDKYNPLVTQPNNLQDMRREVFGTKFAARPRRASGVLITTDEKYLDMVPERYHRKISDRLGAESRLIVAWLQIDLNSPSVKKEWYINVSGPGTDPGFLLKKANLMTNSKIYALGPIETII